MATIAQSGLDSDRERTLDALVEDPKWEVRKEVADHLLVLNDDHFLRYSAQLRHDANHYVVQSTRRAMDRRRKGVEEQFRIRRGILEIQDQFAAMKANHGSVAANRARRMSERMYDITVGATVHEIRGLITPLLDWVARLRGQADTGAIDLAYARKHLSRMHDRLETLHAMIEDMREYSWATPAERTTEALHRLVAEAIGQCQDWFDSLAIDISMVAIAVEVPSTILVSVSRYQVVVALRNVIKNAIESLATSPDRFTPGQVRISASLDDDVAIIQVADTGMGLSADEVKDLGRFIPGKTSMKRHGTGFGLPIAWRKLQDHGGSLTITSQPDVGTTVTLFLPIQADDAEEA